MTASQMARLMWLLLALYSLACVVAMFIGLVEATTDRVLVLGGAIVLALCMLVQLSRQQRPNAFGEESPVHDVYVRVRNVMRVGIRSQEVTDGVVLDWQRSSDGSDRLVGVKVLSARGVEMNGLDVVKRRPHGTGPEWRSETAEETR